MGDIIINYEKSTSDVPVLIVARKNTNVFSYTQTVDIIKTFTGDEATELYKKLTYKEAKINGN